MAGVADLQAIPATIKSKRVDTARFQCDTHYTPYTVNLEGVVAFISYRNCGHRNIPITTRESRPFGSPFFHLSLEFDNLCSQFGLEGGRERINLWQELYTYGLAL